MVNKTLRTVMIFIADMLKYMVIFLFSTAIVLGMSHKIYNGEYNSAMWILASGSAVVTIYEHMGKKQNKKTKEINVESE